MPGTAIRIGGRIDRHTGPASLTLNRAWDSPVLWHTDLPPFVIAMPGLDAVAMHLLKNTGIVAGEGAQMWDSTDRGASRLVGETVQASAGHFWTPPWYARDQAAKVDRVADDVALHHVRLTMTRWLAMVGCLFSVPVVGVALVVPSSAFNPWATIALSSLFPVALLNAHRRPQVAGAVVSLAFFVSVAIGGYLNLGSGVLTINPSYAVCVVIASACWSSTGSFIFALLGGVMATYAAHVHTAMSAQQANLAGAKVAALLLVLAGTQRFLMVALVRARGRMLAHEERLESLVRESPEGMLVLDKAHRIRLVNPSAAAIIGREIDDLLGDRLERLGWLEEDSLKPLIKQCEDGQRASFSELASRTEGQVVEGTLSRLTRSEGDWRYLLVLRDITARRAEEHAREELMRRVRESTALESLGRLAGGVAHDFNNLLTVILNTTELAGMREPVPGETARDLATVQAAAKRAASLTAQLLAVARKQVLRPIVLCPNQVVEELLPLLDRLLPENVSVRVSRAHDLWNVAADPAQLGQVLVNLVTNAVDAMREGGALTIETKNTSVDVSRAAKHPDVEAGDYVQLSVSDTGVGMTEDTLSRVFEPFFTTKEKERGTGLGLATVHGIIRQSGGHVHVYSEPTRGTTFRIYLPRVLEPEEQAQAPEEAPDVGRLRILLVEDQAAVRASVRRMLVHLGHEVWVAESGEAALTEYGGRIEEVDLLMLDVVMPGPSGPELATALRAGKPNLRVLYMSGYTEDAIVHHGALDPGVDYLAKPFGLSDLKRALAEAWEKDRPTGSEYVVDGGLSEV